MKRLLPLALLLSGCSMTMQMIPVEGPLSQARTMRTIDVQVKGIMGNSGKLAFSMPDGDHCEGRWVSMTGATAITNRETLLARYGRAYLSGMTVIQSGQNPGQAFASCTRGRTVEIEFFTNRGTAHGAGIAKDSDNNVFRMIF